MSLANFITEIKNTPIMLKIATLMYIIPALVLLFHLFSFNDTKELGNLIGFLIYFFYALYNMLIAIFQIKRNILIWRLTVILPFIILICTFSMLNNENHNDSIIKLIYFGYLLLNLFIGIGWYKKNIIKWCIVMILPYIIFIYSLSFLVNVEYRDFIPQLIYSGIIIFIFMIGFGLFKKNIVAKWFTLILPYLIASLSIFLFIDYLVDKYGWFRELALIEGIIFMVIALYFAVVAFLISRPKIKILFEKLNVTDVDKDDVSSYSEF